MKNRSVFSASILFILFSITASALPGLPLDWGHSEISNTTLKRGHQVRLIPLLMVGL